MKFICEGVGDGQYKRDLRVLERTPIQDVENGIFYDMERFEKEKIYNVPLVDTHRFTAGKNKNHDHPNNHWQPRL